MLRKLAMQTFQTFACVLALGGIAGPATAMGYDHCPCPTNPYHGQSAYGNYGQFPSTFAGGACPDGNCYIESSGRSRSRQLSDVAGGTTARRAVGIAGHAESIYDEFRSEGRSHRDARMVLRDVIEVVRDAYSLDGSGRQRTSPTEADVRSAMNRLVRLDRTLESMGRFPRTEAAIRGYARELSAMQLANNPPTRGRYGNQSIAPSPGAISPITPTYPPRSAAPRNRGSDAPRIPSGMEGLSQLSAADRSVALRQQTCPVTGEKLGAHGKPLKVSLPGRDIFVCCAPCVELLRNNPRKYLTNRG